MFGMNLKKSVNQLCLSCKQTSYPNIFKYCPIGLMCHFGNFYDFIAVCRVVSLALINEPYSGTNSTLCVHHCMRSCKFVMVTLSCQ